MNARASQVMTEEERAVELDELRKRLDELEREQPRNRAERRGWRKLNADNEERMKHLRRVIPDLERSMLEDFGHC